MDGHKKERQFTATSSNQHLSDEVNSTKLPSMNHVVWSACFCKLFSLKKRQRLRESSFGIDLTGICISSTSSE